MAAWADCISACGGLAQATATRAAASTRLRYTLRFDMVRASPVGEMTDRRGLHRETSMSRRSSAFCWRKKKIAQPGEQAFASCCRHATDAPLELRAWKDCEVTEPDQGY